MRWHPTGVALVALLLALAGVVWLGVVAIFRLLDVVLP